MPLLICHPPFIPTEVGPWSANQQQPTNHLHAQRYRDIMVGPQGPWLAACVFSHRFLMPAIQHYTFNLNFALFGNCVNQLCAIILLMKCIELKM